jgi:hypothetical protein
MEENFTASRELDLKVALKIFGFTEWLEDVIPHYSTDRDAAQLILNEVVSKQYGFYVGKTTDSQWGAYFANQENTRTAYAQAATIPLAICLGALKLYELV